MKENLKDLIMILSQEEERKKLLKEALKAELRSAAKDLLEEIALAERKLFCEQNEDVCNGYYSRGLDGLFGKIDVRVPRTRDKVFRPFFLEPYKRTSYELEDLVVAMYQGGCSTRDISRTVGALIDGKYSANWVSKITDVVQEKVEAYRNRPIKKWYPIAFIDGTVINIRRGSVDGEVVYIVLGIDEDGYKEVLGFWLGGSEGESSDIWKEILYELQKRGLKEPLLFIGDGLKGLSGAINEVYPVSDFQSCILHKVRSSLKKVRVRHRAAVGEDLKRIYRQKDEASFKAAFNEFKERWHTLYPEVTKSWEADLEALMTYLKYPEGIRKTIYTTNPLERFIKEVKRRTKVIEVFSDPEACSKVVYLVAQEMNEKYGKRAVLEFSSVKDELLYIRRGKYGPVETGSQELCTVSYTQTS